MFGLNHVIGQRAGKLSKLFLMVVCVLTVGGLNPVSASTVCQDGTCDYMTIGEALANASIGETITVRAGTYYESGLTVNKAVTLISEHPEQPELTVIDAGGNDRVLDLWGTSQVIGFTIQNGHHVASSSGGGGIRVQNAPIIRKCIIQNNVVTNGGVGGGIWSLNGGTQVIDCVIRGNTAKSGGGIYFAHGTSHIIGCEITDNHALGGSVSCVGGGINLTGDFNTIRDTQIIGNSVESSSAVYGGGIRILGENVVENCVISGNWAVSTGNFAWGGGIQTNEIMLINSTVTGNSTTSSIGGGALGGGIHTNPGGGAKVLLGVDISGNFAGDLGGGIYCGGKIRAFSGTIGGNTPDQTYGCVECALNDPPDSCDPLAPRSCADGQQFCTEYGIWGECEPVPPHREDDCGDGIDNDGDCNTDMDDDDCKDRPPSHGNVSSSCGNSNEPVNTLTGELYNHYRPDIYLPGPLPVFFSRYYASGLVSIGVTGRLGQNWRHNFEWSLTDLGTTIEIIDPEGRTITFDDVGGNWVLAGPSDVRFQLVEDGTDFLLGDPRSNLVYVFDSTGKLTGIEDGKGNVLTLTYTGSDLTGVSDGLGRDLVLSYDGDGKLAQITNGTRNIQFGYSTGGVDLTSVTDLRGMTTTYAYAPGGLLTSWTRPELNRPYEQTYDGSNRVETQTSQPDTDPHTHTFAYAGDLTTMTDPMMETRTHTHNARGELMALEGEDGVSHAMDYEKQRRRTEITDRLGDTTRYTYDETSGKLDSKTNADGTLIRYSYVPRNYRGIVFYDLSVIYYPDDTTQRYSYDGLGNLIEITDAAGEESTYTYNDRGQVLSATNPAGGVTTFVYNGDGTLASRTDPSLNETTYGYDAFKRLNLITFPDVPPTTQSFTYDDGDHLLTSTDRRGNTTTWTYDDNGNLETVTDRLTRTTTLVYDDMDHVVSVEDPLTNLTAMTYDAWERLETVTDPATNVTSFGYDARGRLDTVTDGENEDWSRTYDLESIIASTTNPLLKTTNFISDKMGRITSVTSPLGHSVAMTYDDMGRLIQVADPLDRALTRTYDDRGLVSSVDWEGLNVSFARDEMGRIETATDPNANDWLRDWDAQGRLASRTDPLTNQTSYSYDTMSRLSVITLPGGMGTIIHTYDENDNLTDRSYTGGLSFSPTYDDMDRLLTVEGVTLTYDENGRMTGSNGLTMTRDVNGRMHVLTLAPGKTITYTYNGNNQLETVTDWVGGVTTFSYDAAARLIGISRPLPNGVNTTFAWDDDGRLVGIDEGALSSIVLTRDAAGQVTLTNQTGLLDPAPTVSSSSAFTYDAACQVNGYSYDPLGRLIDDTTRTCTWDLASRLTGYTQGATVVSCTYDGLGYRLSRTEDGQLRTYEWNDALGLPSISVEGDGGNDLKYYVHTPGGALLYSIDAVDDTRRFYHYDEMGNTRFLTDDDGLVVAEYAYTPYGELVDETGSEPNPFTWQGRFGVMRESNTGLYYLRARYYDSQKARFTSRDPIAGLQPRSINPYQYAARNPMVYEDVRGTQVSTRSEWRNEGEEDERKIAEAIIWGGVRYRNREEYDAVLASNDKAVRIATGATKLRTEREPQELKEFIDLLRPRDEILPEIKLCMRALQECAESERASILQAAEKIYGAKLDTKTQNGRDAAADPEHAKRADVPRPPDVAGATGENTPRQDTVLNELTGHENFPDDFFIEDTVDSVVPELQGIVILL